MKYNRHETLLKIEVLNRKIINRPLRPLPLHLHTSTHQHYRTRLSMHVCHVSVKVRYTLKACIGFRLCSFFQWTRSPATPSPDIQPNCEYRELAHARVQVRIALKYLIYELNEPHQNINNLAANATTATSTERTTTMWLAGSCPERTKWCVRSIQTSFLGLRVCIPCQSISYANVIDQRVELCETAFIGTVTWPAHIWI